MTAKKKKNKKTQSYLFHAQQHPLFQPVNIFQKNITPFTNAITYLPTNPPTKLQLYNV